MEHNVDLTKIFAARTAVNGVNNWGKLGVSSYAVLKDLTRIEEVLNHFADTEVMIAWNEEVAS